MVHGLRGHRQYHFGGFARRRCRVAGLQSGQGLFKVRLNIRKVFDAD